MAEAQFMPAGAPASGLENAVGSLNWMGMAQRQKQVEMQQQEESRAQQQWDFLKPIREAQLKANLIDVATKIEDARMGEDRRAFYLKNKTQAQAELDQILQGEPEVPILSGVGTFTPQQQATNAQAIKEQNDQLASLKEAKLNSWLTRYSALENVPDGKVLYDQAGKERKNIFDVRHTTAQMDALLDRAKETAESKITVAGMQKDLAESKIQLTQQLKDQQQAFQAELANMKNEFAKGRALEGEKAKTKLELIKENNIKLGTPEDPKLTIDQINKLVDQAYPTPTVSAAKPAATATKPSPKSTVTPATSAPVKVSSWDEAKALTAGTKYIGPDGQAYTRGI
jgi:hypothetical protein